MLLLLLVRVLLLSSKVEGIKSDVYLESHWDCCPPTCALADTANVIRPVKACDKDNHPLPPDYQVDASCGVFNGGNVYTCADQSPWAVNETTSYGFAQVSAGAQCCACYHLSLVSRPGDDRTRTIVVQHIDQPTEPSAEYSITVLIPGLLSSNSCGSHYSKDYQLGTESNRSSCDGLEPVWRDGCRWRSDWLESETSANVSEVPCPAALTEKSGCRRNDEVRLFPSTLPASIFNISSSQSTSVPLEIPSPKPFQNGPEGPTTTGLSTGEIIGLGVSVSVFSLLLALLIYWRIRRRSKLVKQKPRKLVKKKPRADETSPAAAPGYDKPELQGIGICELATASLPELNHDNIHEATTGATASELHPTHLLEMDASNLPELDAISLCKKPVEERLEAMRNPTNRF